MKINQNSKVLKNNLFFKNNLYNNNNKVIQIIIIIAIYKMNIINTINRNFLKQCNL